MRSCAYCHGKAYGCPHCRRRPKPAITLPAPPPSPHTLTPSALVALYQRLSPAEQLILSRLATRIDQGREQYGHFDPATDTRDFLEEAAQESLDLLIYAEMRRQTAR